MRQMPSTKLGVEILYVTSYVSLGTTAGETAALARERSIERLLDERGLTGPVRERVRDLLLQVFRLLILDSDNRKKLELQPAFAGDKPEQVEYPTSYLRMASPGGQEIIDGLDTPPYEHMKEFVGEHVDLIEQKSANAEAQGCRFYGAANAYADILRIDGQIKSLLEEAHKLVHGQEWGELVERGFPLSDETFFVNVCGSGAGGQATGLFVPALVLLNVRLPLARSNYRIAVDFMAPGYFRASNDAVAVDQSLKSLSVLDDLFALKAGGTVKIPHPHGAITFGGARARDVFDECYFHPPRPTNGDAFGSFVSRVSSLMVDRALSPYADAWRSSVANDPYLASVPELV
jgi:hypothetical protein